MTLEQKLLKKIASDVTSTQHLELEGYVKESIKEMQDIVGKKMVDETSKFDIAYFRFLLYVKQNDEISEADMSLYEKALKKVKEANAGQEDFQGSFCKVGKRIQKWY